VTSKAKANFSRIANARLMLGSAHSQYGCGQQLGDFPVRMSGLDFAHRSTGDRGRFDF
jgi:hypothetical protein